MKKIVIYSFSLIILAIAFFVGYKIKCQEGIDLVVKVSLKRYLPFWYLQKSNPDVLRIRERDLLNDSFDPPENLGNWSKLWMRQRGKVTQSYDKRGVNDSFCLLISSDSRKDWCYQHNKLVEVYPQDRFSFEGFVNIQGEGKAVLSVGLYNKDKEMIQWGYSKLRVETKEKWTMIKQLFTVPPGVKYIRFKISGWGKGEFRFDNIKFQREI